MRGKWLRRINDTTVDNVREVEQVFCKLRQDGAEQCSLVLLHPEIRHGLTTAGIPQVNLDQLNSRHLYEKEV